MHCICPKNSVAYIIKRQAYQSDQGVGYQYSFACSPQSVSCLFYILNYCKIFWFLEKNRDCDVSGKSLVDYSRQNGVPKWKKLTQTPSASVHTATNAQGRWKLINQSNYKLINSIFQKATQRCGCCTRKSLYKSFGRPNQNLLGLLHLISKRTAV